MCFWGWEREREYTYVFLFFVVVFLGFLSTLAFIRSRETERENLCVYVCVRAPQRNTHLTTNTIGNTILDILLGLGLGLKLDPKPSCISHRGTRTFSHCQNIVTTNSRTYRHTNHTYFSSSHTHTGATHRPSFSHSLRVSLSLISALFSLSSLCFSSLALSSRFPSVPL